MKVEKRSVETESGQEDVVTLRQGMTKKIKVQQLFDIYDEDCNGVTLTRAEAVDVYYELKRQLNIKGDK